MIIFDYICIVCILLLVRGLDRRIINILSPTFWLLIIGIEKKAITEIIEIVS